MGGERHAPAALSPGKQPGIHDIRGWVGPRASLDGYETSHPPPGFDTRSESLYRLRHPGQTHTHTYVYVCMYVCIHTYTFLQSSVKRA